MPKKNKKVKQEEENKEEEKLSKKQRFAKWLRLKKSKMILLKVILSIILVIGIAVGLVVWIYKTGMFEGFYGQGPYTGYTLTIQSEWSGGSKERIYNIKRNDFISRNLEKNYSKEEHSNIIVLKIVKFNKDDVYIWTPEHEEDRYKILKYGEEYEFIGYDESEGDTYTYKVVIDKEGYEKETETEED